MPKRKARSQTTNLTPNHKKLGISPIYLHAGGVPHTFEKLSMRATTFLETSPQLEVCIQYYGPLKLQEAQFQEFRDSHLGVGVLRNEENVYNVFLMTCNKLTKGESPRVRRPDMKCYRKLPTCSCPSTQIF